MVLIVVFCDIAAADSLPGYAIITTSDIVNASSKLADFIAHKESLGFNVYLITEEDFGGSIGDEAAENIRRWLQQNYEMYNIEYVLLIGDPRPDTGEVPMKLLWPRHNDHPEYDKVPSDYYYSDLSGDWDLDKDGCFGEQDDDTGKDGMDLYAEVHVGRIPYYGLIEDLDYILDKTINYENSDLTEWRKNALLAANEFGYLWCETIKDELLVPVGWPYHRIYDEEYELKVNLDSPPETVPCTQDTVYDVWSNNAFGLAVWSGHGYSVVDRNRVPSLDDNYPSFTYSFACQEARPEDKNNLAYTLLKNGGICTCHASRDSASSNAQPWELNSGAMGLGYRYVSRLMAGLSSGESLSDARGATEPEGLIWAIILIYNIYGDPALHLVPPVPMILYVDQYAVGRNDGSSWNNAYNYLQDALARCWWKREIRVAQGVYKPDQGAGLSSDDRTASFLLKNYITIKGGYGGCDASDPNERNVNKYETILSGDIGIPDVTSDNSYHVITGNLACEASVEGFTITQGNADGNDTFGFGGGAFIDGKNNTFVDCTFLSNSALGGGGLQAQTDKTLQVINCAFYENHADNGAGFRCWNNCDAILTDCVFENNTATMRGGGINISANCNMTLNNCRFSNNYSEFQGGGLFEWTDCEVILNNCLFDQNYANNCGAGVYISRQCFLKGTNITFANNSATRGSTMACCSGTGLQNDIHIINSIIWDKGEQIWNQDGSTIDIMYSDVQGGWPGETNIQDDPLFADPNNNDYHLKSSEGHWDTNSNSWVQDDVNSPCIDTGDPNSDWSEELWPHGGRINMGAYGGTSQASMSLSDIGDCRDLDNDGLITWDDVLLLVEKWNCGDLPLKQDLNLDGIVNINDLAFYEDWSTDSNNSSPIFKSIGDQYISAGCELSFSISAKDTDGDKLVYQALGLLEGAEFSEQTFTWTPEQAGTYSIAFVVSDYKSLDYMTVNIIVE
ncbi:MAG: hypothetical protein JXA96_08945 [Sedimentisphaerales bacterium]|nr:hypothetical protein [Sedimentisphaerales bacterium]